MHLTQTCKVGVRLARDVVTSSLLAQFFFEHPLLAVFECKLISP